MKKCYQLFALVVLILLALVSCSTTSHLPEGETLYQGMTDIRYLDKNEEFSKDEQNEKGGVIRSIAHAARQVQEVVHGTSNVAEVVSEALSQENKEDKETTKAEEQALKKAIPEINAVLEYPPNNSFFGSAYTRTPLPIGLWAYNAYTGKNDYFSKTMYKVFAGKPVLVSTVNPDTRIKIATNTLHNFGYFRGKVDYSILPDKKNEKKAKIRYYVKPGKSYLLDSISYKGFPLSADTLIRRSLRRTYLRKGEAFNVSNLTQEQQRLETILRNRGFYYYKANSTVYKADTFMVPFKVQLVMQPKMIMPKMLHPWYMGRTYVDVVDSKGNPVSDTTVLRTVTICWGGEKMPLYPGVWLRNIAHRHGQLYRQIDEERTSQMLSSLGIFSQVDMKYVAQDTTATCDTLNLHINAVLDKPYTSDFEMNVTEKNSDRIGPGLAWSLQRKNAFRGAELVKFQLYGSYEWRTNHEHVSSLGSFFNSYDVGTQLSFDIPRIVFPGISRRRFRFPTATTFALSAEWLNRAGYFNLFSSNLSATYSWHKNLTSKHEFIPFSLTFDKRISSTAEFDSIMTENPALYVSMRDRFVPAMQYTYTYTSPRRSRNPLLWKLTVKEAGNVTSGIYAMAGESFDKKDKELFKNPFAQYVKLSTELHKTYRLTEDVKLVTRIMAGAIWSYGNSTYAPYSDLFFVGGANSIRGFTLRTVGPGHYYTPHSKYSYMDQTGDLKFEGNAELRFPVFGESLFGAVFLDVGNVWLLHEDDTRPGGKFQTNRFFKDLATGTGFGLRYDMSFLVLRLDLGVAIHDPARTGGYYNLGKWTNALALHFAIGYPF